MKFNNHGTRAIAVVGGWTWGEYYVWDGETGRLLHRVHHNAPQHSISNGDIDESGRRFVTGGCFNLGEHYEMMRSYRDLRGCLVDVWEKGADTSARTLVADGQLGCLNVGISRDGARVACSDNQMNFKLWDAQTGKELASVASVVPPDPQRERGTFSDDATRFVSVGLRKSTFRKYIRLCDLKRKTQRVIDRIPSENAAEIYQAAIAGNGREFAVWASNATGLQFVILDFETGLVLDRFPLADRRSFSMLAFSSDGMTIAKAGEDGWLDIVERSGGRRVELRVSDGPVRAVAFLPGHDRVRVISERAWIPTNAARSEGHWAGPMRIADYRFRFQGP